MNYTCPTCGDALPSGSTNCYRCTPNPVYTATTPGSAPASSGTSAAAVIGTLIIIVGFILMAGNITGLFPTFPFAGFIVIFIGGLVSKAG
jgi:hypothetical protein